MKHFNKFNFYNFLLITCCFIVVSCSSNEIKIGPLEHFKRGNQYYEKTDFQAAIREYKAAVVLDPMQESFYFNLGLAYYSLQLYEESIVNYKKAIELKPGLAKAWYNLALIYDKMYDPENSFIYYEKYLKLNKSKEVKKIGKNNFK